MNAIMTDKTFNQLIVVLGFVVVTVLYTLSWILNRPLDWQGLFAYVIPAALHITNVWTANRTETVSTQAQAQVESAKVQAGGLANGVH